MKTQSVSTLIALVSTLQVAAATGFGSKNSFSCPSNTNNECNPQQNSGYDWSSLAAGSSFSSYGGIGFSGWGCANSFGKRDPLAKRTFANSKCITGSAHRDKSKASSFSCGANTEVKKFSVTEMHVSVEFDCDLEFHYEMPDKSTCKQTAGCSTSGSIIKNSQCGGATGVTVIYPPQKPGKPPGKDGCNIGIHSIGFDCSPPSSTKTRSSTTKPPHTKPTTSKAESTTFDKPTTTPVVSSPVTSAPASSTFVSSSEIVSSPPVETTPATSVVETTSLPVFSNTSTIVIPSSSGFTTLPSSSAPVTTEVPSSTVPGTIEVPSTIIPESSGASSVVSSVPPQETQYTTVVITELTTTCPFTSVHTTEGSTSTEIGTTVSTIQTTITSTVCNKCQGKPTDTPPVSVTTPSGPAVTAPGVPSVLPQCLNTWNFIVGCFDNTDAACYCPSADFVNNVFGCLTAYGADAAAIASAASYFQGICAPYIPQNPAIITGCPSSPPAETTPVISNPVATITSAPVTPPVAVTTIVVESTYVVPCVESTGVSSGLTITSSSTTTTLSTTLTVPQVVFSTPTAVASGTVTEPAPVLVVGTPAPVPAVTTPAGNSGATTIATVPIVATRPSNGTAPTTIPFQANSASSSGVAFGSVLFAALLAVFAI